VVRHVTASGRDLRVYAHRGYHGSEPENTLAAFAQALAMGVDGLELDVRQTASGTLVCFHDWYLKRLTGTSGRLSRTATERLLELSVHHPTTRKKRPVATLDEVLTLVADSVEVILDLKLESVRPSRLEQDTITLLRQHGVEERVTISSFNPWVLKRVKQLAPRFRTALIASSRLSVRLFHPDYCDGLHVHHALLNRSWFNKSLEQYGRLLVWTVDQRGQLLQPTPDAVRGIITNRPQRWGVTSASTRPPARARPGVRRPS
jgi:glycerophosphoryl diester phosphodiesterase